MYNSIFLIHSAHDFVFYINLSKKKKPILIITTSIMYNAVKYNFPNSDILQILYFDLTEDKIKKNKLLLKNIIKLTINFSLIFYKFCIIKIKYTRVTLVFSHLYSLCIMQALGVSKLFKFKIIRKIIENSHVDKDEIVNFYDKRVKIYEFFLLNKILPFKVFLYDKKILFTTDVKYKKILSIKKNYLYDYNEFIKKKYNFLINRNAILILDCSIGQIEDTPGNVSLIDRKKTCNNIKSFLKKKTKEGYLIYFKKRLDHYYFDGPYFCDLIKDVKIYEINRYIPSEFLLQYFKYNYSIFSYTMSTAYSRGLSLKKYSFDLSYMIEKIK
jgi:hypothetical protein